MNYYNVEYGPKINLNRCAATIHGNCSNLKKKSVLQYPNGTEIIVDSIAMFRGEGIDSSMEVLLKGELDTNESVLLLKE